MGQKISTMPIDKSLQDQAKWNLYLFVLRLLRPNSGLIQFIDGVDAPTRRTFIKVS